MSCIFPGCSSKGFRHRQRHQIVEIVFLRKKGKHVVYQLIAHDRIQAHWPEVRQDRKTLRHEGTIKSREGANDAVYRDVLSRVARLLILQGMRENGAQDYRAGHQRKSDPQH